MTTRFLPGSPCRVVTAVLIHLIDGTFELFRWRPFDRDWVESSHPSANGRNRGARTGTVRREPTSTRRASKIHDASGEATWVPAEDFFYCLRDPRELVRPEG
jgi:hypothetical protein